jgi:phosphate/sulfate permease
MPDLALVSVVAIVLLALVFDFTNGFHDAANSIATVVSTRVLTPRMAVVWAALFNFIAFLVFQTHVANTALLHPVRSRRAEASTAIQNQITRASSSNATVSRRIAGSSTASSS